MAKECSVQQSEKSILQDVTLTLTQLDLDMVKMYYHTKNEVSISRAPKSYRPSAQTV